MKPTIKNAVLIFFAVLSFGLILALIFSKEDTTEGDNLKREIWLLKQLSDKYQDSIRMIDKQRAEAYKELIILGNMTTELQNELNKANIKTIKTKKLLENEKRKSIIIPDSTTIDSIFTRILQGR